MAVTIGIPTFNRLHILKMMAGSLYKSNLSIPHNIRIYDDSSTEYSVDELKSYFPTAISVNRNSTNIRADRNMYSMYKDFLETSDEYFFNADSDLLFHTKWLERALELLPRTEGILSIFNANSHPVYKRVNDELCIKEAVGAAGTLFSRNRLEELMGHFSSIDNVGGFDWQFSQYFTEENIPIYCTTHSLVQHIGYTGQNTRYGFDVGINFEIETINEGQIINDVFVSCVDSISKTSQSEHDEQNRIQEELANDLVYHIKRCLVIILKHLLPKSIVMKIKKLKRNSRSKKNGT